MGEFNALCDIASINASCSAVFQLPEGHFFDVPNAALGLVYYLFIFLREQYKAIYRVDGQNLRMLTVLVSSTAMSSSVFLAIKLLQLGELCLLCWTTHLLNVLLLTHFVVAMVKGDGKVKMS